MDRLDLEENHPLRHEAHKIALDATMKRQSRQAIEDRILGLMADVYDEGYEQGFDTAYG